jgi:hypothetical protein
MGKALAKFVQLARVAAQGPLILWGCTGSDLNQSYAAYDQASIRVVELSAKDLAGIGHCPYNDVSRFMTAPESLLRRTK